VWLAATPTEGCLPRKDLELTATTSGLPVVVQGDHAPGGRRRSRERVWRAMQVLKHGGRTLYGTPPTPRSCHASANAMQCGAPIVMGSGIRRGR
jgi:isopentenyl diphosphate isomerase/L-lactate dehydrogenase-like FMN-dependent dehydrogenase